MGFAWGVIVGAVVFTPIGWVLRFRIREAQRMLPPPVDEDAELAGWGV